MTLYNRGSTYRKEKAYEYVSCEMVLFYLIKKAFIVKEDQGE